MVGAEMHPYVKAGGLGDVMGSLPKALAQLGADVTVMIPGYKKIIEKHTPKVVVPELAVPFGDTIVSAKILEVATNNSHKLYLISGPGFEDRDEPYGYPDDAQRFIFFCRAVIESIQALGLHPDVLQANDWHTGILPVMMTEHFEQDSTIRKIATVYTIHNLAYQGVASPDVLKLAGLSYNLFIPNQLEFWGQVNLMKGGILWSDIVSTVSETYAKEIQTPALGEKLDGVISSRRNNLVGILNGIDYNDHDWETFTNFSDLGDAKEALKAQLQTDFDLEVRQNIPLMSVISRLVEQKGLDLFCDRIEELLNKDVQLIILGTGTPDYEEMCRQLALKHPGKVATKIGFDAKLAEKIYCASDIFLMPSRFEPCGLGQMIALHYGTVPVVRATGGLAETVMEYDPITETGNGFAFTEYSEHAFASAIFRALETYRDEKTWNQIKNNATLSDFSWKISARKYMNTFERAIQVHRRSYGALKTLPQLRKDPILRQWVIISTERSKRPSDYGHASPSENLSSDPSTCPFCSGHENMTPPEIFAFRDQNTIPDAPGWDVRVFDNRYPALVKEEAHTHSTEGIFASMDGIGAHEVVVETPDHFKDLTDLTDEELAKVVASYKDRYVSLCELTFVKYVLIFRNHGKRAGASLFHPHSQIIATPIVPKRIHDEISNSQFMEEMMGVCPFCAILEAEQKEKTRIICENDMFSAFSPYAARFPFETWIMPKRHMAAFGSISPQEIRGFASVLGDLLRRLKGILSDPPYNFMIHSSPCGLGHVSYYHWHMEIIPRLTIAAGFEWGSDFYINPTPPEEAARFLRESKQGG